MRNNGMYAGARAAPEAHRAPVCPDSALTAPRLQTLKASGEKLAALAAELKDKAARKGGGGDGGGIDAAMADSLVDLGIVSPVTKQSAGKRYQEQLARELSDFLAPLLRKEAGMMVLHDVFCVFNRCAPACLGCSLVVLCIGRSRRLCPT